MATQVKFHSFVEALAEKKHNLGSDEIRAVLTNVAPNASTNAVLADITQISNGGGYTTGGNVCSVSTSAQTGGVYKLVLSSPTAWTATGAGFGPFRYVAFYNNTATNDELIAYVDYGSSITVSSGTFTVTLDGSAGVLTIT